MRRSRAVVGVVWLVVAPLTWLVVLTAITLLVTFVGHVVIPRYESMLAIVGASGGLIGASVLVGHLAGWVQRFRLRRLRRRGSSAVARVERQDARRTSGRGASTRYTLLIGWDGYRGERHYHFDGRGPADFVTTGATVTVRYPAGRPHRFIVDIPYAASMVDQFA